MVSSFIYRFRSHCASTLAVSACDVATLCDFLAATAFVLALVPQLHKNSYIKSVVGLSILWAAALFTANLVDCFYIFEIKRNIYFKIASIICCVTAFGILMQFWMFSKQNINFKLTFSGSCFIVWGAILATELAVPKPEASLTFEWIGLVLFSIDLLPQVNI